MAQRRAGRTSKLPSAAPRAANSPSKLLTQQLRAARDHLFQLATHLHKSGLLSADDINRLKLTLKRGRASRTAPDTSRSAIQACIGLAEEFALRHPIPPRLPASSPPVENLVSPPRRPRSRWESEVPTARETLPSRNGGHTKQVGIHEITENNQKLDNIIKLRRLVELMDSGFSAKAAVEALQLPPNRVSWARKAYRRVRETGRFTDGRWGRRTRRHVLTPELEQILLQIWNSYPGASPKNVHNLLKRRIDELSESSESDCSLKLPSYSSVWLYLASLPPAIRAARGGRMEAWDKQARPIAQRNPTLYSNQVAQADHTPLRVWARVEVAPGEWMPVQPWLTTVIDVHSRAVMGYVVSARYPDSWSIALAIRHAVLEKDDPAWPMRGKPQLIVFDGGKDFNSDSVKSLLNATGIDVEFCAPHNPNEKPEQERLFLTLKTRMRELRSAMENIGRSEGAALKKLHLLPTVPQVRQEVHRFISEYHQTAHSSHGELPVVLWTETARIRPAESHEMDVLLLKDDQIRTVTKEGIRFTLADGSGGLYRARELWDHWRHDVRLRYNPDDMLSVLVYAADTGAFICEAWLAGAEGSRYTDADVLADRKRVRQGILERTRAYVQKTIEEDRPRKRQRSREELAEKVAKAKTPPPPAQTPEQIEREARKAALRAQFKQADRGPAGGGTDV